MLLFKSWAESIKPSNLKLLFLVTLNMLRRHYKFFAGAIILAILFIMCDYVFPNKEYIFLILLEVSLILLMPFIFVLVLRPSIKRKNLEYFWDYKWHFLVWLIVCLIDLGVIVLGYSFIESFIYKMFNTSSIVPIFTIVVPLFVLPIKIIEIFFVSFWLDSRVSPKNLVLSVCRATKMFAFNLSIYLIFIVIPYLCFMFFIGSYHWLFGRLLETFVTHMVLLFLLASIFYISFLVNLYTKNIHDKFSVYFGE